MFALANPCGVILLFAFDLQFFFFSPDFVFMSKLQVKWRSSTLHDLHWTLYYALALTLLHIWEPTCLTVLLPEFALALPALLKCPRFTHLSLTALLVCKDLHGGISHKCHCGTISYYWLAMLLLLAEAERYEGNVS